MSFKTLDHADVAGKRVLLRADLNVPVRDGAITDLTRIERLSPTIRELAEKGARAPKYNEALATKAVSGRDVEIAVDLGLGNGVARVWTCDLTHGYIDINGSYRS